MFKWTQNIVEHIFGKDIKMAWKDIHLYSTLHLMSESTIVLQCTINSISISMYFIRVCILNKIILVCILIENLSAITSCCASSDSLLSDFHIASVSGAMSNDSRKAAALFDIQQLGNYFPTTLNWKMYYDT